MFYGEVHNYKMINKATCKIFKIDGKNIEFFDKNTFLTWSWDFEAGYYPNQISMYEIKNRKVLKTGEFEPQEGGPSNAKWVDKNNIRFELVTFNENHDKNGETYRYQEKAITKKRTKWVMH